MFFVSKKDKDEIVELVHSGAGFCIVVDQRETIENKNPIGRILKYGKKDLKRNFRKIKENHRSIKVEPLTQEAKKHIIETFENDKIGIMNYTEDYIENNKLLDRQEEIKKQKEADRKRLMKELADDFNPNGIKVKGE